jgi:hypothetical protein
VTRREWDESDDDDPGFIYPPAPVPPHERVWRHPSELAGASPRAHRQPSVSPFGRGLAIVTGIVGVAFVVGMARLLISPEGPAVTDVSATTLSGTRAAFQPFSSDSSGGSATTRPGTVPTTKASVLLPSTTAAVATVAAQATTTALAVATVRHAAPVGDGSMAVTTARELETGASVTVRLADGSSHQAAVLKVDRDAGVALVRLDRPVPAASSHLGQLPEAGSPVRVITDGRTVAATVANDDGIALVETDDDAAVAEGAAITDQDGALVGLCTWEDHQLRALDLKSTPALMATPSPDDRGWLGIVGGNDGGAVVVMRVQPSSPAELAGLLAGDVITEVDGMSIASFADLRDAVADRSPGASVTLTVLRGSSIVSVTVTLAPQPTTTTAPSSSPTTTAVPATTTTSPTTTLAAP